MRFLKIFALLLVIILSASLFAACDEAEPPVTEDVYHTVTFNTAGGGQIDPMRVLSGSKISAPPVPVREGFLFDGWLNGSVKWNFEEDTVTSDITLKASWINARTLFDYEIRDGVAVILGYKGSDSSVVLPRYIDGIEVSAIGDRAFENINIDGVTEIVVGDNIRSIGEAAFADCDDISIKIEGEIKELGERAFFGCAGLDSIRLDVQSVPYAAFSGCVSLSEAVFTERVESIGENAFEGCSALASIVAHNSLRTVSDSSFIDCGELAVIYYYGTALEWESVDIATGNGGNDALLDARLYIYSALEPAADSEGEYWYIDRNGNKRIW